MQKAGKRRDGTMKITIAHNGGSEWLKQNLEDFVWSLDKNLRRRKLGKAIGEFGKTELIVEAESSDEQFVKDLAGCFVKAMRKDGQKLLIGFLG
jgi:hypothetical protein